MSTMSGIREQEAIQPVRTEGKRRARKRGQHIPMYLSIAPFYILFALFGLFPVFFSLYLAFQRWDGIEAMKYIGLNNFAYLLTDQRFWQAISNTLLIWVMSVIPTLFFAVVTAFLLNTSIRKRGIYQVALFIPHVTSVVAIALIFGSLFGNQFGLINAVLRMLGIHSIAWLQNAWGIRIAIATMIIWRSLGYNAIIYLAGLQSIPKVLYEAARIDGARTAQIFWHITLPLLRPVILFTVITSTISGLQVFTEPQVLVGNDGGPGAGGMTMVLYLYQQAFAHYRFGYGAAVGWGMFIVIVLFSVVNWKIVQKAGIR